MEQCLQQYYCYSCLDVETSCIDGGCRGVLKVRGCTLRTLYFVNSGEVSSPFDLWNVIWGTIGVCVPPLERDHRSIAQDRRFFLLPCARPVNKVNLMGTKNGRVAH